MTHLFNKHKYNLESASLLIYNYELYAPSVHCSYYASFQLIKCKLGKLKVWTSKEIDKKAYHKGSDSHKFIFETFLETDSLIDSLGEENVYYIERSLDELKESRKKSDYFDFYIDDSLAIGSYELSKKIISLIEKL